MIDNNYVRKYRDSIHLALEDIPDIEFLWLGHEIKRFEVLWRQGMPLSDIAKELNKSEISVLLQAFDRLLRGVIEPRKGWQIW